jgi:hypothetical protein
MTHIMLKDIPRVKAGLCVATVGRELGELDQERLYLATRAKDLLGYTALVRDVTGEGQVGDKEGKLTDALRTLDIQVLDTSAVIEYQLQELTRENREVAQERLRDWAIGYFTPASWAKTELKSYNRPVPEYVLDKAVRLKEQLPEVQFHVQHLSNPKADPFLVASVGSSYGNEIYYIEAWDEPRFEGRVTR